MRRLLLFSSILGLLLVAQTSPAAFHVMQIEEVIGGVAGDPTAQAIELRLLSGGQTLVSNARIRAWNSSGTNPITVLDLTSNISNGASGADILLATPAFESLMSSVSGFSADFTLANAIPVSYLSGGKLTFEGDDGTVYWSVAFGGSNYTGTNTGNGINTNGGTGNFGPAFAGALPTTGRKGIIFTGSTGTLSTSNATDYAFTSDPATVENNAGKTFTVVPEPGAVGLLGFGAASLGGLLLLRQRGNRKRNSL